MADKFEELFEEAMTSGKVDSEWLDRFRSNFEASPLRNEIKSLKEREKALREQATQYRNGLLQDKFSKLGITISPSILNIPEELNPADDDGFKDWAVKSGLVKDEPTTPEPERAVHDRIAAVSNESSPAGIDNTALLNTDNEEEFWRLAMQRQSQNQ